MKILAIETSCDETSAAVSEDNKILSNIVSSSIDLHAKYGGVVPEIAARAHIEAMIPVIEEALKEAKTDWDKIDAIAVTSGPGLNGSLLVGVNTAKTLACTKNKPLIPVHHIEGHIYSSFARETLNPKSKILKTEEPVFPILALVVSGGHTSLILMEGHLRYNILGQTIDDAAGEVFDKVAKLLNLGYPGGPIVSKLAKEGDASVFKFPRVDLTPPPSRNEDGFLTEAEPSLNFSFSGLKTAVLNEIKKEQGARSKENVANLCASFQQTVIDILIRNSANAIKMYKPKSFVLCGGVSANKELREQLKKSVEKENVNYFVPDFSLTGDNAAMISQAAYYKYQAKEDWSWQEVNADPNLKLVK